VREREQLELFPVSAMRERHGVRIELRQRQQLRSKPLL